MATSPNKPASLPEHVAIIMDGNGRWAKGKGLPRLAGHRQGAKSVRNAIEHARKLGIHFLTLYAFSTENWDRPEREVSGLMKLLEEYLRGETSNLVKNGIRLKVIGDVERLPSGLRNLLLHTIDVTARCTGMTLVLALSYGGRGEIVKAAVNLANRCVAGELTPQDIDEGVFESALFTCDIPDPDLLIRTSNEFRISNFLLWQLAYAELVFTEVCWPDFDASEFDRCLEEFASRERRFGRTSEQCLTKEA
ncbi:MAG: isoprenyl transferase [Bdellovibrionales bacterium]|nr:isoprenyl transferase [Bdellovibrionales bacterium]